MATETFKGFPKDAVQFLAELALSNEREWFEKNNARYEASVREPALQFIRAMAPKLKKIAPHFVASDKKVGGSLMRIHRDVRFGKDKSPYKTNVGMHFRHEVGKDVHAPGIYVHLEPGSAFLGVGLWHPEPAALAAIRARILEKPAAWTKAKGGKPFTSVFGLAGESLKRPPQGIDPEHPLLEDLKRKDHIAVANLKPAMFSKATIVDELADRIAASKEYLRFLCGALELPS
jgi:uncharacterized protein (TIGR02453 family)